MPGRRASLFFSLLAGAVAGGGYPIIDLALACRKPVSEACVWGKAYFSLNLGLSLFFLGGAGAGLMYALLAWHRKRKGKTDAV
jgi:hypothetical protein